MSLNRGVAALGAVALVGVATLGFAIPYAHHNGKPVPDIAVVAGSTWLQVAPDKACYNAGKELNKAQQLACQKAISAQVASKSIPVLPVTAAGTFGINVDQLVADKGWSAIGEGGDVVPQTKEAYAGPLSVATLLSASQAQQSQGAPAAAATDAPVLVIAGDRTTGKIYGEWLFQVKVKGS